MPDSVMPNYVMPDSCFDETSLCLIPLYPIPLCLIPLLHVMPNSVVPGSPKPLKQHVKSRKTWTTAYPEYMNWSVPFACEFCEYRTDTRAKLYQHAVKKHWHSGMASFLNTWGIPNSSTSGILFNSSKLVQFLH